MIRLFFKEYRIWYLQFCLLILMYLLVFSLYHLPLAYFLTASLISVTLIILVSIFHYLSFRRKLKTLQEFSYVKELETLDDPSDLEYRRLISKVIAEQNDQLDTERSRQKDLDALIKIWSHQMKIPLSAISLMVQTDHLSKNDLQKQLLYLENHLNQLLSYLKFSQNKDDYHFEKLEISSIVKDILKEMAPICFSKDISFTIDGNWTVISDKKWLRFALMQIIDNAIKYSHQGGHISIKFSDGINISDNGIGILSEDIPRLFEEGYTGFNGHEHQKASGLGLFMTKTILHQLQLDIKIESQVDQGTKVSIFKKER
ncbi:sensor histidine kinase [Streptococcus porcinus]|uniref:histidine kinase n=1 Tax=Streptococcus porcinus TaxID=1340 RepID=A0A7W0ARE8_STRPO|nr:HAMP domain-containing sensor histidine kinase [Streptococcus porcinus]MBA2796098.1 HAMP domain-containing histidine kinase [Streptococcus porcinus]